MSTQVESGAKTLPARYYTDPEIFRDEVERFYCESWICAGRTEQVTNPGDYFLRKVGGESIIITRDAGQKVRAFFNVCRHRGTRLVTNAEGKFSGRIQCGYHGWTYGLDGRLIGAPHMDEAGSFCREDYPLNKVHAEVWDGNISSSISILMPSHWQTNWLISAEVYCVADARSENSTDASFTTSKPTGSSSCSITTNACTARCCIRRSTDLQLSWRGQRNSPHSTYIGGAMGFRGVRKP
jgi:nitrite reductase/ring-hydroxylating ferredoxin subunit